MHNAAISLSCKQHCANAYKHALQ